MNSIFFEKFDEICIKKIQFLNVDCLSKLNTNQGDKRRLRTQRTFSQNDSNYLSV